MEKGEPIRKCFLNRYRAEKSSDSEQRPGFLPRLAGRGWGSSRGPGERQAARRVV